jgi:hypothetical protein
LRLNGTDKRSVDGHLGRTVEAAAQPNSHPGYGSLITIEVFNCNGVGQSIISGVEHFRFQQSHEMIGAFEGGP